MITQDFKTYSNDKPEFNVEFEQVDIKTKYALTISPASARGTFKDDYSNLIIRLKPLFNYGDIELYPELSKLGRLHFHGYVTFKKYADICFFYKGLDQLNYQFVLAKNFKTHEYEKKAIKIMQAACEEVKLPYPLTNKSYDPQPDKKNITIMDSFIGISEAQYKRPRRKRAPRK